MKINRLLVMTLSSCLLLACASKDTVPAWQEFDGIQDLRDGYGLYTYVVGGVSKIGEERLVQLMGNISDQVDEYEVVEAHGFEAANINLILLPMVNGQPSCSVGRNLLRTMESRLSMRFNGVGPYLVTLPEPSRLTSPTQTAFVSDLSPYDVALFPEFIRIYNERFSNGGSGGEEEFRSLTLSVLDGLMKLGEYASIFDSLFFAKTYASKPQIIQDC